MQNNEISKASNEDRLESEADILELMNKAALLDPRFKTLAHLPASTAEDIPYLLDQTPRLLFISSRNFVRLLFESGY